MSVSMYRLSIPVFQRGLAVMSATLDRVAARVAADGSDPADWVQARLAPDMLPLAGQVQRASDTSKNAIVRLAGVDAPRFTDDETTLPQLQARITNTLRFFEGIEPAQLDRSETRQVTLSFGKLQATSNGDDYLLQFALPNFFFHVATAHDIVRHRGLDVGKLDYLGPFGG